MKILVAEDDFVSRRLLEKKLDQWGYDVITVEDGKQAWDLLQQNSMPDIAILDWMMPEIDGVDICKMVRGKTDSHYVYIILLTAKSRKEDITTGLSAGADDYMIKPFDQEELHSRIKVGMRIINLERQLAQKISQLEAAMAQVKQLKGFLPICANCKKIRNDDGYWQAVEIYVHEHSDAVFSHSICPECTKKLYPDLDLDEDEDL